MGVNDCTYENWTQGRSKPHGLEEKAMNILIKDYDRGVALMIELDETANKNQTATNVK